MKNPNGQNTLSPNPLGEDGPDRGRSPAAGADDLVDAFIARWSKSGASERANYQLFLSELCTILGVPQPDPTTPEDQENAYVFERRIPVADDKAAKTSYGFIDFYRRGCFVLETKQGVERKDEAALSEAGREREAKRRKGHGHRGSAGFDQVLLKAKHQAERYIRHLPPTEGRPPFLIVVDVGHTFEIYAEFSRTGGAYTPFPAGSHRFLLTDLRRPEIRERLRLVWTDPLSLDPARRTAAVTREVAAKLAALAKSLEADGHDPQLAAYFLMRCIFTMFAEDVELLPKGGFGEMLKSLRGQVQIVPSMLAQLWKAMDTGEFFPVMWFRQKLLRFNGGLFREPRALAITDDQLELLIEAAKADWRDVEPAIFGTLLERALDPTERHKLGAHYTPRAYVERLVLPTVIEPLRADWQAVQAAAAQLANSGKEKQALAEIEKFHRQLCHIRVLDPACGTGNFLYVTLEHLKRLEGEVLDTLERFGGNRSLEMDTATVRPSQMRGIEINPRAAVIAELVLWIGYLQWHLRTAGDVKTVSEPVLEDAKNIEARDAILAYDDKQIVRDESGRPKTHWDGRTTKPHPVTGRPVPDEHAQLPIYSYENPRPAAWPQADFIVGNPPFIGNKRMYDALGRGYVEAVRQAWKADDPGGWDFVMFWWNQAAKLLRDGKIARFGFITTNSISQSFNRKCIEAYLSDSKCPVRILFAIPDHPWVDSAEGAAVRIAMTVASRDHGVGQLSLVTEEREVEEGEHEVTLSTGWGEIHSDLKLGIDFGSCHELESNQGLAFTGMYPLGQGFLVQQDDLRAMGVKPEDHSDILKPFKIARDLTQKDRRALIIDFYPRSLNEAQEASPELFQWVLDRVKPERDQNPVEERRRNWWLFTRPIPDLREALKSVRRYISVPRTAKFFTFQFLAPATVPDTSVVAIVADDAFVLGILSSSIHVLWATTVGGRLGMGNDTRYQHNRTFKPFPFPDCTDTQRTRIRKLGEALDAHRKSRQAAHPDLTMTGIYNVLEKLRSGGTLSAKEKTIHEQGLISILKQLHDDLDAAVAEAYGWPDLSGSNGPADLSEEEILTRLVALNHARAEEEKRGHIRWLRPEYQARGQKSEVKGQQQEIEGVAAAGKQSTKNKEPRTAMAFPKSLPDQIAAVRSALATMSAPADATAIAKLFKAARKDRIEAILESLQALGHAHAVEDGRYTA